MNAETKKTVRRLDLARGVLILTLILYIAVALIINSSYLTVDRMMRLRSDVVYALSSRGDVYPYDPDEVADLQLFQDGYAVLTRNKLIVCAKDGHIYSTHTLQYNQPVMKVSGKYILCFDRGGTQWSLFNSFRVLSSGTEKGDIINGTVSDEGYFAVSAERNEYKGAVTVYNTDGTDLSRWNSDSYLIDALFTGKNRLAVVSVVADREKTHTVFTQFNFKKAEVESTATAADTFPLALSVKENGHVEMLTAAGATVFDGEAATPLFSYPESSPGVYRQRSQGSVLSYQTSSGDRLVQAVSGGKTLFTARYNSVLSLDTYGEYWFVLTETHLYVLDSAGNTVLEHPNVAASSKVLASPELSLLLGGDAIEVLDLSSLP